MGHTSTNLLVHIIFSTKQRAPFITTEIESDLHAYLGGIIHQIGGVALAINGTTDHVHILTRVPAKRSVADPVCLNKNQLIPLDSRTLAGASRVRLANRLRSILRQRIRGRWSEGLHLTSERASQEEIVSRRVSNVPSQEQDHV